MAQSPQLKLLNQRFKMAYGGELLKKAKARRSGRVLSTKYSMHLVLRSSKAVGDKSFATKENRTFIRGVLNRFAKKYGIKIHNFANVGNHLHMHIRLSNRYGFHKFIRAVTGAIAIRLGRYNRWAGAKAVAKDKFFDYRPFTRVVVGLRAVLSLKDYIRLNELEGYGIKRSEGRYLVQLERYGPHPIFF